MSCHAAIVSEEEPWAGSLQQRYSVVSLLRCPPALRSLALSPYLIINSHRSKRCLLRILATLISFMIPFASLKLITHIAYERHDCLHAHLTQYPSIPLSSRRNRDTKSNTQTDICGRTIHLASIFTASILLIVQLYMRNFPSSCDILWLSFDPGTVAHSTQHIHWGVTLLAQSGYSSSSLGSIYKMFKRLKLLAVACSGLWIFSLLLPFLQENYGCVRWQESS